MRSWRKVVSHLLIAILVVIIVFLLLTNINYYFQLRNQTLEADKATIDMWTRNAELRLDSVQEHIRELMLTVYNNTSVFPASDSMSPDVQSKCLTAMENKLNVSHGADCFFIRNTETGRMLFTAQSTLRNQTVTDLKAFCRESDAAYTTGLNSDAWFPVSVNGEPCFYKSILLGKYIVGAVCRVSSFDVSAFSGDLYDTASVLLVAGEQTIPIGGGLDLTESIRVGEDGLPSVRGSGTSVTVDFSRVNGVTLLVKQHRPLFSGVGMAASVILLLASILCVGLIICLRVLIKRLVVAPTSALLTAQEQIRDGNINYRITEKAGSSEFDTLYDSFNSMADQIRHLRIESYDKRMKEQESRLRMLRAQIRPHFYLNAITTVSNMTYLNKSEEIRSYLQALAKYMRYMMNMKSHWITVGEVTPI